MTTIRSACLAAALSSICLLSSGVLAQDPEAAPKAAAKPLRDIGQVVVYGEAILAAPLPGRVRGRVDVDKTLARVRACRADTFAFAIGDGDFDWDDFQALAKGADAAGIKVWASFRLPQHGANSRPFLGAFEKWAEEIAELAATHASIAAVVLVELDYGRNPRFLHPPRTTALRKTLNAAGVSLLGSIFDPEKAWITAYDDALDGVVLRWTKFNQILNLTGMLAGLEALCPAKWKRLVAFETRPWGGSREPFDPLLLGACLNAASKRSDGVVVRQLDLAVPATILPQRDGSGAHFTALETFTKRLEERKAKKG